MPYQQAWDLQNEMAGEIARGQRPPSLLLLEHPHTYTFGRRGHLDNLLWDEAERDRHGVSVYWVDRGGDVTYHGPGQLVGYPLLPLSPGGLKGDRLPQADYVGYVRKLELCLIAALQRFGVAGRQVEGLTGVWVENRGSGAAPGGTSGGPAKIAAIGVKVDAAGVSRHGFALNVAPDMAYWEGIIGCGLPDHPVTSLARLIDPSPPMEQVIQAVIRAFEYVFDYQMVSPGSGREAA